MLLPTCHLQANHKTLSANSPVFTPAHSFPNHPKKRLNTHNPTEYLPPNQVPTISNQNTVEMFYDPWGNAVFTHSPPPCEFEYSFFFHENVETPKHNPTSPNQFYPTPGSVAYLFEYEDDPTTLDSEEENEPRQLIWAHNTSEQDSPNRRNDSEQTPNHIYRKIVSQNLRGLKASEKRESIVQLMIEEEISCLCGQET